jgi:hypothetical protein
MSNVRKQSVQENIWSTKDEISDLFRFNITRNLAIFTTHI